MNNTANNNSNNDDKLYMDLASEFLNESDLNASVASANPNSIPNKADQLNPNTVTESDSTKPASVEKPAVNKEWAEERIDLPGQVSVDIYETKNNLIVVCPVPGVKDDIDLSINAQNILRITGSLNADINEPVTNHLVQECYWGKFSRTIALTVDVKKEDADIYATQENGVLKIVFVKINQDAVKKISIRNKRNA